MARKTIYIQMSTKSISEAIRDVRAYKQWVVEKTEELTQRLAEAGAAEARVRFSGARYDDGKSQNDVSVSVERAPGGYRIVAQGGAVFFIEFGAGVYYNGSEPYPEPRPSGIAGIGEYGKGYGKRKAWGFYDENGNLIVTHGTQAAMPMLHASRSIMQDVAKIAREVFA